MKNKKLTYYVLIPAVIIIWGIIIYKIIVKVDDFTEPEVFSNKTKEEKAIVKNDVYQLINNYSDPFIYDAPQTKEVLNSDLKKVVKPKIENKWPAIRFNGYILNGGKIRCHLTINGEDKILQEHENVMKDYIVSKITSDSVRINYQGNSRWFKK